VLATAVRRTLSEGGVGVGTDGGMLAMSADASANELAKRKRLAARRKALGLTQEDLAGLIGVERSTVVRWERGDTEPQPWIRARLAKALRVSADRIEELLTSDAAPKAGQEPAPERGPSTAAAVPRLLPAAIADFTGRGAEVRALTQILDDAAGGPPGTVVISAIGGTAGIGKTALALHWAHRVAGRFGDGQLYVNLRGFDPSGTPASPAEVIRGFLDALGVPPDRVPPGPDAQEGMYRGLLADRKVLIVLDNARDERQVRPLLPASPASLVVVTSRNQLSGLAAADGARLLSLDVLSHGEAVQLLTVRVGRVRATAEPEAITEIATLCACLPLALAVAAARATVRPSFRLAALAAELRDAAGRLDALDADDPTANVRAVFSWSYQQLSAEAARMFRLLGLHPGPDITAPAAASLAATDQQRARRLLRELARAHLITEHVPGRYAFHDLLRAYAAAQAGDIESEPDREAAIGRLLDHYLHSAYAAALIMYSTREPITLAPPRPGTVLEPVDEFHQAMAWFQAEYRVLLAATALADDSGFDAHGWQIPWTMADFFRRHGRWHEWAAVQSGALAAAQRAGDPSGEAMSRRLLANACSAVGDFDQASAHLGHCLDLYRRSGDSLGEANVEYGLALVADRQQRYADALGHSELALRLFQALGRQASEVEMLNNIGWYHAALGDYHRARELCRRALDLNTQAGNRSNEGIIWDSLGYIEHLLGNYSEAAACYERAVALGREFGDRVFEGDALTHLGDTRHAAGDLALARDAWQQALVILDDLGHPDAGNIRAKIADLPG
jgi:tetratricopeptide (TPR) repeat protein/transcriptional regulator with XRE-family HTH domain